MGADLSDLIKILFRIVIGLAGVGIFCAILYQAYDAWRSALLGVQPKASAVDENPKSASTRLGALAWALITTAISGLILFSAIFGGSAVLGVLLKPWAPH
jgi:hypothetical protein